MIKISKREVEAVRENFPEVHIRRTMHKYYMEENKKALAFLEKFNKGTKGVNRC